MPSRLPDPLDSALPDPLEEELRLKEDELYFLSSLFHRSYRTTKTKPRKTGLHTIDKQREIPEQLRVAALAFDLGELKRHLFDAAFRHLEHHYRPVEYSYVLVDEALHSKSQRISEYITRRTRAFLKHCRSKGKKPHVVVLNELCLAFRNRRKMEGAFHEIAQDFGCYIVPGSYHCLETGFGVAPVMFSGEPSRHATVLKQNSAVRQEERIRTPDERTLEVFSTDFGNFVVWICLDLYDPGLVFKFLGLTNRLATKTDHEIHLALIPSYNGDSPRNLENTLRRLSQFTQIPIVLCNSHREPKKPKSQESGKVRLEHWAYYGGESLPATTPKGWRDDKKSSCSLYEIDFQDLRMKLFQYRAAGQMPLPFSRSFRTILEGKGIREVKE